jgi:hypothetical protein
MTWDGTRRAVAVVGGNGVQTPYGIADFWWFRADRPASYERFGAGCAGSNGTPALGPVPGSAPWLGDTWSVRVDGTVPLQPVAMLLGTSRTTWFGLLPLPLELGFLGMPGCRALVQADLVFPLANFGTYAPWSINICTCPEVVGGVFYHQALVFDPQANAFGATTSNALAARVGAR